MWLAHPCTTTKQPLPSRGCPRAPRASCCVISQVEKTSPQSWSGPEAINNTLEQLFRTAHEQGTAVVDALDQLEEMVFRDEVRRALRLLYTGAAGGRRCLGSGLWSHALQSVEARRHAGNDAMNPTVRKTIG